MKHLLEIVSASTLKDMQKKINQWQTIGILVKYDITPLANGDMLFRILTKKAE